MVAPYVESMVIKEKIRDRDDKPTYLLFIAVLHNVTIARFKARHCRKRTSMILETPNARDVWHVNTEPGSVSMTLRTGGASHFSVH